MREEDKEGPTEEEINNLTDEDVRRLYTDLRYQAIALIWNAQTKDGGKAGGFVGFAEVTVYADSTPEAVVRGALLEMQKKRTQHQDLLDQATHLIQLAKNSNSGRITGFVGLTPVTVYYNSTPEAVVHDALQRKRENREKDQAGKATLSAERQQRLDALKEQPETDAPA